MPASPAAALSQPALAWLTSVLRERLCDALQVCRDGPDQVTLRLEGSLGAIVFDRPQPGFLGPGETLPVASWDAASEGWHPALGRPLPAPGARDLDRPLIERADDRLLFHYDLPGLIFWMLTRREEIGSRSLDRYERFPATASHAFRNGYLERPVVDEWLHVLGQAVARMWPGLKLASRSFEVAATHDVDFPSRYAFRSFSGFVRAMGEDVLRRGRVADALRAPWIRWRSARALHPDDPSNTFEWLMDISERHALRSTFFFICGHTSALDGGYEPENEAIRTLMRQIHRRGHQIGLHASFNTFRRPATLSREAARLKRVCTGEGIRQDSWGGRKHYVRWESPTTLRALEAAGLDHDNTLTYADRAGFRSGTCIDYPAYDPVSDHRLKIRIRPLVVMECTVMDPVYMGLGVGEAALETFLRLKRSCRAVNGTFSLLWHNSELHQPSLRDLYTSVLTT